VHARILIDYQGTDIDGRRKLEMEYFRLPADKRRAKEVYLADLSGFHLRENGTLDYGTEVIRKKLRHKCIVM